MTRSDVEIAMSNALKAPVSTILPLVDLDFVDDPATPGTVEEPVRAWGGIGDLYWAEKDMLFKGVGNMGEIGPIQADAKGSIPSLELSLLGLEADMIHAASNQRYRGRRGKVWLACFDENLTMQGSPALYFAGEISSMNLIDGAERRINVTIDSRMAILKKTKTRYRSDEDQQRRHPGDEFFNFATAVTNKTIYWGLKAPVQGKTTTPTGGGSARSEYNNHYQNP